MARYTTVRPGTIERVRSPTEKQQRWIAQNLIPILEDLQAQFDQGQDEVSLLATGPKPGDVTRRALARRRGRP